MDDDRSRSKAHTYFYDAVGSKFLLSYSVTVKVVMPFYYSEPVVGSPRGSGSYVTVLMKEESMSLRIRNSI